MASKRGSAPLVGGRPYLPLGLGGNEPDGGANGVVGTQHVPSITASTWSCSAISGMDRRDPWNPLVEAREITRRDFAWDRSVLSSSVIPSARYSSSGLRERLIRGKTASERIAGAGLERYKPLERCDAAIPAPRRSAGARPMPSQKPALSGPADEDGCSTGRASATLIGRIGGPIQSTSAFTRYPLRGIV